MNEKGLGYILLFSGLALIVFSLVAVVAAFTGNVEPFTLFNFDPIQIDANSLIKLPQNLEQLIGSPKQEDSQMEIVSSELINDTSNLFAYLILMGFVGGAGYRIGSLGVNLVRPIKINSPKV